MAALLVEKDNELPSLARNEVGDGLAEEEEEEEEALLLLPALS